jgi:hypothetical protein
MWVVVDPGDFATSENADLATGATYADISGGFEDCAAE